MKLRQILNRLQAKELLPQQEYVIYKSQFFSESHASRKTPSLLQLVDYIRVHHNRILNDDFVYKPDTDVISPDFQHSLNCLSINCMGHINSQFMI